MATETEQKDLFWDNAPIFPESFSSTQGFEAEYFGMTRAMAFVDMPQLAINDAVEEGRLSEIHVRTRRLFRRRDLIDWIEQEAEDSERYERD